jgi:hypothetical protein
MFPVRGVVDTLQGQCVAKLTYVDQLETRRPTAMIELVNPSSKDLGRHACGVRQASTRRTQDAVREGTLQLEETEW